MMGLDILPSEVSREASQHFGDAFLPFVQPLLDSDAGLPLERQGLPLELSHACIATSDDGAH